MKRLLMVALLALLALAGRAQASIVNLDFLFRVDFANTSFAAAVGLPVGALFTTHATFDDAALVGGELTIPSDGSAGAFALSFGNFSFTHADDSFGGPLIRTTAATGGLPGFLFETTFAIPSGASTGSYLLSFNTTQFQVTPAGNTVDFVMTGVAVPVPEPSTYVLLVAGLGVVAVGLRRRRRASA